MLIWDCSSIWSLCRVLFRSLISVREVVRVSVCVITSCSTAESWKSNIPTMLLLLTSENWILIFQLICGWVLPCPGTRTPVLCGSYWWPPHSVRGFQTWRRWGPWTERHRLWHGRLIQHWPWAKSAPGQMKHFGLYIDLEAHFFCDSLCYDFIPILLLPSFLLLTSWSKDICCGQRHLIKKLQPLTLQFF